MSPINWQIDPLEHAEADCIDALKDLNVEAVKATDPKRIEAVRDACERIRHQVEDLAGFLWEREREFWPGGSRDPEKRSA